jgi:DNA-binding beta-propeller fold protein YncE
MFTRRNLLLGSGALAACGPKLARRFNGFAFTANEGSRSVSAISLSSFKRVKDLPVAGEPTQLFLTAAPHRLLALSPANGAVSEIDPTNLEVGRQKRVGASAISARCSADGRWLWVLCREPQALIPLDLTTFRPGAPLKLPAPAADFDLDDVTRNAIVSLPSQKAACLANLATGRILHTIDAAGEPHIVRFRPDGRHVLIGNPGARSITIADASNGRFLVTLPLGLAPERFCFTTDNGGQLFVSGQGMDAIAIVSPYQTAVSETILAGRAPGNMAVNASHLFVANPAAGDVTVVSIADRLMMAKVPVGQEPVAIAITPDDQYALVLNRASSDLAVIRFDKITDFRYKRAPLFTVVPVGERPAAIAVFQLS